jgi:hypothetical protein
MLTKLTIPTQDSIFTETLVLSTADNNVHSNIISASEKIGTLYGKSSIAEDIVLNRFLSVYSLAKSISPYKFVNKNVVVESFLSQQYVDTAFPIDKALNIDLQNGDLVLPIKNTITLQANSIIIESGSNGSPGDLLSTVKINDDITSVLTTSSSALFRYEKICNALSLSNLCFIGVTKLAEEAIANGIYIRLYADNDTRFATIENVSVSQDGITWIDVQKPIEVNKADYYIRFTPMKIRYARVKIIQDSYITVGTSFGAKYRYSIGIREITIRQTEYEPKGEYVSVAFNSGKQISSAYIDAKDIGTENIKYFISNNNGTKWKPIAKQETISLDAVDNDISTGAVSSEVRVKIEINKANIINKTIRREYIIANTQGSYYLKAKPIDVAAYVGNHISYGEHNPYVIDFTTIPYSSTNTSYTDSSTRVPLYYIPYESVISPSGNIVVQVNGSILKNDSYEIIQSPKAEHSIISIPAEKRISGGIMHIYFKPYIGVPSGEANLFHLPQKTVSSSQQDMFIQAIDVSGNVVGNLTPADFTINTGEAYDTVRINEHAFNPYNKYSISYLPIVKIREQLTISNNSVSIAALPKMPSNTQICVEYSCKTVEDTSLIPYFTSICNEYKLELI